MKYTLEICTDSVASAVAAQKGGAKRIELCSGLVIGGLSPDPVLFKGVRANTDLEIRTLLRPRFGDFCYDEYEFEMLKEEVQMYREFGADRSCDWNFKAGWDNECRADGRAGQDFRRYESDDAPGL